MALIALVALFLTGCAGIAQPQGWASPVSVDGLVLVQVRAGQFAAVDPASGQVAWRFPESADGQSPYYATPIVAGNSLYIASYRGRITRLELDGRNRPLAGWEVELERNVVATPVLSGSTLYVASEGGRVEVVNANTGAITASHRTNDRRIWGRPALRAGQLFLGDLDSGATLALDTTTGAVAWTQSLSGATASDLLVDGDLLFVGSFDRSLHALDVDANGAERWKFQGNGWFVGPPVISGGTVYAATMRGAVYAIDRATGAERWRYEVDGEFRSSPALVDGVLIVASRKGRIAGLDPATGTERWAVNLDAGNVNAHPLVRGSDIYYVTERHELFRVTADGRLPQRIVVQ